MKFLKLSLLSLILLASSWAQILYVSPSDPAALAILSQLEGTGVPAPDKTLDIQVVSPLGAYKLSQWVWDTPSGEVSVDIALTVLTPKVTQLQLIQAGVLGIQPIVGTITSPIAQAPTPVLVPAAPAPAVPLVSPVGAKRVGGIPVALGDTFDKVGGGNFPLGYIWTQGGHQFTLGGGVFNEFWTVTK